MGLSNQQRAAAALAALDVPPDVVDEMLRSGLTGLALLRAVAERFNPADEVARLRRLAEAARAWRDAPAGLDATIAAQRLRNELAALDEAADG